VFLATLGLRSGGLHSPGVVMGNLGGGFALLGVLGWMVFREARAAVVVAAVDPRLRAAATLAIAVLAGQILLGGLTSANFAATACTTLPDCQGRWLPDASLATALDLGRDHPVDDAGRVQGGGERVAIHLAHRWGALAALLAVLAAAVLALRAGAAQRNTAVVLLGVVVAEAAVGAGAVLTDLPIALAVAHNALAGLLLLALLHLRSTLEGP
jgi:cytochrome c oxidase assembly protein subunit 15